MPGNTFIDDIWVKNPRFQIVNVFRLGGYAAIFIGIAHLIGHSLPVEVENVTEARLLDVMTHYDKKVLGGKMSMMDIQNGLSLCYSIFFLTIGSLCISLVTTEPRDRQVIFKASAIMATSFALGTLISLIYFFWLPVVSFLTLSLIFGFVVMRLRPSVHEEKE
jgi:hypothetical protein